MEPQKSCNIRPQETGTRAKTVAEIQIFPFKLLPLDGFAEATSHPLILEEDWKRNSLKRISHLHRKERGSPNGRGAGVANTNI